eukprot:SM000115S23933  [mRNA]  locus=s115:384190:394139:+ [translate_table: standard]
MEALGDDGAAGDDGLQFLEKLAFAQDRRQVLDELLPGCEDDYFYRGQQLADVDPCAGLLALQEGRIDEAVATLQKMEDALGSTSGMPHASAAYRELQTRVRLCQWDVGQMADTCAFLSEELDLRFDDKQDRLPGVPPDGAKQLPSQLPTQCSTMDHLLGLLLVSDRRYSVGALADGALAWVAKSLLQGQHDQDSIRSQLLERLQRPVVPLLIELIVQDGTTFGGCAPYHSHIGPKLSGVSLMKGIMHVAFCCSLCCSVRFLGYMMVTVLLDEPFENTCKILQFLPMPPPVEHLSIHSKLTLQQMDELRDKLPEVATMPQYVHYYCQKLQPSADLSLLDDTELSSFLDRLQPIALLSTTLQAEVLLGRLMLGMHRGRYDPAILKAFLKVHKHRGQPPDYVNTSHPAYIKQTEVNMHDVTRNNHVESFLDGLVPGWQAFDAPAVVKAYFLALFSQARSTEFLDAHDDVRGTLEDWQDLFQAGLLSEVYCTRLLAEARLCAGVQNPSEYLDILRRAHEADRRIGPSETAASALFERVEIDFSPANPRVWSANADITLQVILKHVPELTIKVFEINLLNYFTENPEQCVVQPDIDLDGYTPGHEEVRRMKSMSPLLRNEVQLQLHEFQMQRGCVVVDLSGNGAASRAIFHKGSLSVALPCFYFLSFVERQSAAGHVMRVLREDGSWAGATTTAIADGREYHAEGKLNEIVIPFSSHLVPWRRVLLCEGSMVSVGFFKHHQERYELQANMWLSEGSLLAKQEAPLVVRTSLLVNGFPAPLAVLESPRIVVTQRCKGAVTISHEVPHVVLSDDEDLVHSLRVHHEAEGFTVTLSASVRLISKGGVVEKLSASRDWAVEQAVGDLGTVDDLYLTRDENGYKIAVKGLAGEAKPGRVVGITLRHMLAMIWSPETTELATDGVGFCHLGQLHGVAAVEAWLDNPNLLRRTWDLAAVSNHHTKDVLAVQVPVLRAMLASLCVLGVHWNGYVMERRWAEHLGAKVGNMLPRPQLLLQPWPLRKTRPPTPEQLQDSTSFLSHAQDSVVHRPCAASAFHSHAKKLPGLFNQADGMVSRLVIPPPFYPEPLLLSNLRTDSQGRVVVPAHALPPGSSIAQVVAVDVGKKRQQTVSCSFSLSSQPSPGYKETTLKKCLTPGKHYVEERLSDVLKPGRQIDIADTTSQVQIYDTVAKVHGLFTSLMRGRPGEDKWKEFAFVAKWHTLSLDTKRKLHAQYASHELDFYLFCKDQYFFNAHVKPSLETKMDCDFLDLWLLKYVSQVKALAADLKGYQNLNAAERCLLAFVLPTEESAFVIMELEDWNADTSNTSPAEGDRRFTVALKGGTLSDLGAAAAIGFTEASDGGEDQPSGAGQPQQYVSTRAGGYGAHTAAPQDDEGDWEKVAVAGERGPLPVSSGLQTISVVLPRSRYLMQDMVMRQPFARHAALQDQTHKTASVPWTPFLTSNLTDAVDTITGSMMALAVLDLPFGVSATLPAHQVKYTGEGFTFLPSWPVVYYCQQLREIVATNEELSVLLQIPQGAVPVGGSHTIVERHQLAPLHMAKVEIRFYFPQEGSFTIFPAHVSRGYVRGVPDSGEDAEIGPGEQTGKAWEGELLAFAHGLPTSLQVVAAAMSGRVALSGDDAWTHISQLGTGNEVLDALRTANIRKLDLSSLAWRLRSSAFFKDTISILRQRKMYSHKVWAYSVFHKDAEAMKEFIAHCPHLVASCRHPVSAGTLLPLHSGSRGRQMPAFYEHLEYSPWVNARAHTVGKGGRASQRLSSPDLRAQYRSFLALLVRLPAGPSGPTGHHALQATYYLLLQDRVDDAARLLSNVTNGDNIPELQAGYMAAYLDMSMGDSEVRTASHVAEKYAPYCPVSSWQPYFQELADQVQALRQSELDVGVQVKGDIVISRAASPAILEMEADREGKVVLRFQGIASIQVNAYIIDEELLFSKDPFRARKAEQPPYVVPNWTHNVSEDKHESSESLRIMKLELPQMLLTVNVLLEARGGGLQRMLSRFRTPRMTSEVIESQGVLIVRRILESGIAGPPLPGAYVKVYARYRQDATGQGAGTVSYYKDGYTDRLGKFDYASVSTDELIKVEKLAILIAQRELGTLEREVAPPAI